MTTNPGFLLRSIYGKNILMPICRNEVGDSPILLNDVAAEIWRQAGKSSDANMLLDKIADLYGLQEDSLEKNAVNIFINELIQRHLIYL